jgi:hypothetical protein
VHDLLLFEADALDETAGQALIHRALKSPS